MSEPVFISREEFLRHSDWAETKRGWVKVGGFGKPLAVDEAFQIQSILDEIANEPTPDAVNPNYVSEHLAPGIPRTDRFGRRVETMAERKAGCALAPIETGTAKTEGLGAKHESGK